MSDLQPDDYVALLERDEEFSGILGKLELDDKTKLLGILKSNVPSSSQSTESKPDLPEGGATAGGTAAESKSEIGSELLSKSQLPKLGTFSGDEPLGKGEISYIQWKHEVTCLSKEGYSESVIMLCIRRCLKGTAASVLVNLGVDVTPKHVVDKFDVVFGNILPSEMLLENFYTARQKDSESVVAWGCRIETLLKTAKEQGTIQATEDMAKTKFWSGIKDQQIKSALRHKFDSGVTFEELLKRARMLELEYQPKSVNVKAQSVPSDFDKLQSRMDKIEKMLSKLTEKSEQKDGTTSLFCRYCKRTNHVIEDCWVLARKKAKQQENSSQSTPGAES